MDNFLQIVNGDAALILDGAMGTELARHGVPIELPLWSAAAIRSTPGIVRQIHLDYIRAGADIITTATFRTDTRTFGKAGLDRREAEQATRLAIELARDAGEQAKTERKIWIAGSMSPLEDCYHPELTPDKNTAFREHREKAGWLAAGGVDVILIETMNTAREALAASIAALETGLPVLTSFILNSGGDIFNGDDLPETVRDLTSEGIHGYALNCTHHSTITKAIEKLVTTIGPPMAVYANAGIFDPLCGWQEDPQFNPQFYAGVADRWHRLGVRIIGGCCGTTPEHIRALGSLKERVQGDGVSLWTGG